jgi:hypothetical protein
MEESWTDGATPRWSEIRDLAVRAEQVGFDTVWIPDELLWRSSDGAPRGWWECVAMAGVVSAVTSRIKVGTWILSALTVTRGSRPRQSKRSMRSAAADLCLGCDGMRIAIPRHREINEHTAQAIFRDLEAKLGKDWWR